MLLSIAAVLISMNVRMYVINNRIYFIIVFTAIHMSANIAFKFLKTILLVSQQFI